MHPIGLRSANEAVDDWKWQRRTIERIKNIIASVKPVLKLENLTFYVLEP